MTTSLCISHPMPGFTDTVRSSPQRLTSSSLLTLTNLEPGNTPCADLSTYVITPAPGHQRNWAHTWHCQTAAAFQLYHSAPDNYTTHFVYKNILWLMKKSFKSFQLIEEMKNLFLISINMDGNESWLRTRKQVYVIIFTVQRKQLAVCGAESADVESSFQLSNILTLCEAVAAY